MDETDLNADRARGGDETSLVRLYERLAPALHAWARLRLGRAGNEFEADDLVQEVWVRALKAFPGFEIRRSGSFRAWIFTIAANAYVESMRRRGRTPSAMAVAGGTEVPAEVTSITQALKRRETLARLIDRVRGLGAEDRRLFIHRGLEGMTATEVATTLGITAEAAHKRWQRLKDQLAEDPAWRELVDED